LAQAVLTSLNARGSAGGAWPGAWVACHRARLKDGEQAYQNLRRLVRVNNFASGERELFQLDSNMGGCAAMVEMLLQSHLDKIEILPAIPDEWKNGSIKGLCARGGFVVDITWKEGKMTEVVVRSDRPKQYTVKYGELEKVFDFQPNKPVRLNASLEKF